MLRKILIVYTIILIAGLVQAQYGKWYMPELNLAYVEFHDAVLGGDLYAGASVEFNNMVTIEPVIYTYQTTLEWKTYGGIVQAKYKPVKNFPADIVLWGGAMFESVDLTQMDSANISTGLNTSAYSRITPTFGVGAQLDSIEFICRGCDYYFNGKLLIGDFIEEEVKFKDVSSNALLSSNAPETLSTLVIGDITVDSPFGSLGILRHIRMRHWFGDDFWRVSYTSPYCCGNLLRGRIGWETGYLGFADVEVKIKQFSIIAGVKFPQETSLWMWRSGLEFRPSEKSTSSGKCRDVEILSPRIRNPYE
ncbi:hypothetical protein DRQ33_02965 [bacterium]|nr:MAG: hypothetical protein DRQ33_02965 [bacterium]